MAASRSGEIIVHRLELKAGDLALPAALYKPAADGPHPAVVVAPGGLARGDVESYTWAGERLAQSGYVALLMTYRAPSLPSDVEDIALAIDFLQQQASVDAARIAAFGHSRGGLSVLMAGARDPRLRALAAIAPPADPADYSRSIASYFPAVTQAVAQLVGGTPEEAPQKYEEVSAVKLAPRIRQPVLLIHGTADMRMPFPHSQRLQEALRDGGNGDVRLELLNGVGHYLEMGTLGYQFDEVIGLLVAWLARAMPEKR